MNKQPEKYTREWFIEQGRLGGLRTKELHGLKHYSRMGKKKVDKSAKDKKSLAK